MLSFIENKKTRTKANLFLLVFLTCFTLLLTPLWAEAYNQSSYYGQSYYQGYYQATYYGQATYYSQGSYEGSSNSVTFTVPPPPSALSAGCPSPGSSAAYSWTLPSGYTQSYFRTYKTTISNLDFDYNAACNPIKFPPEGTCDNAAGATYNMTSTPNATYRWYVHTRATNGNWSRGIAGAAFACGAPPATADIKAGTPPSDGPISIPYNTSTNISWTSTDADSCSITGIGSVPTSGSQSVGPLTSSQTYTLTCSGPGGSSPPNSVTINVGSPQCSDGVDNDEDGRTDYNIDPAVGDYGCTSASDNDESNDPTPDLSCNVASCSKLINKGNACTISWTVNNATSCVISGPNVCANYPLSGCSSASDTSRDLSVPPTTQTITTGLLNATSIYTITCYSSPTVYTSKTFICRLNPRTEDD